MGEGGIVVYPGYTGVLCLYHKYTKDVIVQWSGLGGVDEQIKSDMADILLSFFKATADSSEGDETRNRGVTCIKRTNERNPAIELKEAYTPASVYSDTELVDACETEEGMKKRNNTLMEDFTSTEEQCIAADTETALHQIKEARVVVDPMEDFPGLSNLTTTSEENTPSSAGTHITAHNVPLHGENGFLGVTSDDCSFSHSPAHHLLLQACQRDGCDCSRFQIASGLSQCSDCGHERGVHRVDTGDPMYNQLKLWVAKGVTQQKILLLYKSKFGESISLSTLQRKLRSYEIAFTHKHLTDEEILTAVHKEYKNGVIGYHRMHRSLRTKYGLHVSRDRLHSLMRSNPSIPKGRAIP